MFFHILGAIAEFEHALMSERTMEGLRAARARGRTGGQKPKLTPRQARIARDVYYTVAQIAEEFGVSRPTIYRHTSAALVRPQTRSLGSPAGAENETQDSASGQDEQERHEPLDRCTAREA